jgi:hypothetical protein
MLAKDKNDRHQNQGELLQALLELTGEAADARLKSIGSIAKKLSTMILRKPEEEE